MARKRFPKIGRIATFHARRSLRPAKELRHGLHAFHQLERLAEGPGKRLARLERTAERLRITTARQAVQAAEARRLAMLRPGLIVATKRGTARAKGLLRAILARGTGAGGPLVITIGVTVNMEDMEDVPDETLTAIESDIHNIMETTMLNTVAEARSLAPVRTGALRASINGQVDEEALMITFMANTGYAIYQEDGTSKMAPNPYLREPAAEAEEDMNSEIEYSLLDHLDGNVEGAGDDPTVDLELETELEYVI